MGKNKSQKRRMLFVSLIFPKSWPWNFGLMFPASAGTSSRPNKGARCSKEMYSVSSTRVSLWGSTRSDVSGSLGSEETALKKLLEETGTLLKFSALCL